ncbi:MAG TPA: phosphatidate cytidylyltransferase, partial [Allosphingosinicella sp.]|nr:phosphatidate cytidylyltransferase [Allosphingosinicella sp.]
MNRAAKSGKSDLAVRTVAGIAMILVAVGAIYLGGWPFQLLVGIAAALMLVEWSDMHKLRRPWPIIAVAFLAANLWLVPALLRGEIWQIAAIAAAASLAFALLARSLRLGWGYAY